MKLIDRIGLIVRANVNSLLGRTGDRTRQQRLREGERELARAQQALARVADDQQRLAGQVAAAEDQARSWAEKVEAALRAGDEAQAREALRRQQAQERAAEKTRARLEAQQSETDRLQARLELLAAGLEQARQQAAAQAAAEGKRAPAGLAAQEDGAPPAEAADEPELAARKARLSVEE